MPLSRSIGTFPEGEPPIGAQPIDTRLTLSALIAGGGAGLAVRQGVFAGAPAALVVGTDGWAYRVRSAYFAVSRSAHDGTHILANDGDEDAPVAAAPGTPGASRIDIIWIKQPSNTENGDTSSTPLFGVASGDPSTGVPNPPAIPAGAMELGRNVITSAATSTNSAGNTITQTWRYTALRGTPIPVRNAAERDELTALASATNHLEVDRLDTGQLERNTGTGWRLLSAVPLVLVGSPTLAGAVSSNDLVPDQTIPAGSVPGATQLVTVEASIQALVASGGGIRLEVLIDGAVVRTTTVGNGGTTTANSPLTVRWRDLLTTSSAHTARARVVNVAGANSVSNDTGQQFTLTIEPALALT